MPTYPDLYGVDSPFPQPLSEFITGEHVDNSGAAVVLINAVRITVNPLLLQRKVYAYFYSTSGATVFECVVRFFYRNAVVATLDCKILPHAGGPSAVTPFSGSSVGPYAQDCIFIRVAPMPAEAISQWFAPLNMRGQIDEISCDVTRIDTGSYRIILACLSTQV